MSLNLSDDKMLGRHAQQAEVGWPQQTLEI